MKHDLEALYRELEKQKITVLPYRFRQFKSVALEKEKIVGLDRSQISGPKEEYTILIHEKGHFDSGAFYAPGAPYALQGRAEHRADRAAILRYIPLDELRCCLAGGVTEIWELAEHFGVTEEYMKKAVDFYRLTLGVRL